MLTVGRLRSKRTKRARATGPRVQLVDCQCELHREGIEDPFPPNLGPCLCACSELHRKTEPCGVDVPAMRILRITVEQRTWDLPVCLPCMKAVAQAYGGSQ